MFICSISQSPTANPVLSLKSQHVFDSQLLESYVNTHAKDPINSEHMTLDDIVPIKPLLANTSHSAQITQQTSIPTLLQAFQDSWDSLALEMFHLRANLDQCKKDLSLALYKQDAAIRVAMKVEEEKEELLKALAALGSTNGETTNEDENEKPKESGKQDGHEIKQTTDFKDLILSANQTLFAKHKAENKQNKTLCPVKSGDFSFDVTISSAKISKFPTGISQWVFDKESNRSLVKHVTGQIEMFEVSDDSTVECELTYDCQHGYPVWLASEPYVVSLAPKAYKGRAKKPKPELLPMELNLVQLLPKKKNIKIDLDLKVGDIIDVFSHPSLPIFGILLQKDLVVCQLNSDNAEVEIIYTQKSELSLTCASMHPDGTILAQGTMGTSVLLFDIAQREVIKIIDPPTPDDRILSAQFASNGYTLVIEYESKVGVYDLRKFEFVGILQKSDNCEGVSIDQFSTLIICGNQYSVYDKKEKQWLDFKPFADEEENVQRSLFLRYDEKYLVMLGSKTGLQYGYSS